MQPRLLDEIVELFLRDAYELIRDLEYLIEHPVAVQAQKVRGHVVGPRADSVAQATCVHVEIKIKALAYGQKIIVLQQLLLNCVQQLQRLHRETWALGNLGGKIDDLCCVQHHSSLSLAQSSGLSGSSPA